MAFERGLHDAALHAGAAAVHESDLAQACAVRSGNVLLDHGSHIAGMERVEIEHCFDRKSNRIVHGLTDAGWRMQDV